MQENNKLNLTSPWAEVKEKIKETNVELTDEDLQYDAGNEEALLSRLEKKMNMSKQEIKSWIESIASNKGKAS